jgi:hypothetical protein
METWFYSAHHTDAAHSMLERGLAGKEKSKAVVDPALWLLNCL